MTGGSKCISRCIDCDYSTIGSIKDVDYRMKLHMKNKHGIDNFEVEFAGRNNDIKNFRSNTIKEFPDRMAELFKLLKK